MIAITEYQSTLVVDSRLIAEELGIEHHTFLKTVAKYQPQVESRFGVVRFEVDKPPEGSIGGRPEKYALLTEPQATILMTFSRNTEQVVNCKLKLVEAFEKAKQIIKQVIPQQSDRLRELELELALAKAQAQRALAEKSVLDTRHLIVVTCPEAVQQKILGYETVIEYRDRIVHGEELINDGTTITKTELCKRYGLRTKNGSPDYRALNRLLANNPISPEAWTMKARIQDVPELKREYLSDLDKIFDASDRQRYLGEGS